jgi:hypothetical protein
LEKQVEALTAGLQKVSAQLEASKPAPRVVNPESRAATTKTAAFHNQPSRFTPWWRRSQFTACSTAVNRGDGPSDPFRVKVSSSSISRAS